MLELAGCIAIFLLGVVLTILTRPSRVEKVPGECETCAAIREMALVPRTCHDHWIVDWTAKEGGEPTRILDTEFKVRWENPHFTTAPTRKIVAWTRKNGKFDKPIYEDEAAEEASMREVP